MTSSAANRCFFELHSGNPREGPGGKAFTYKALDMLEGLPVHPVILDVGCGPGQQSLDLAEAGPATIVALDYYRQYLEQLAARINTVSHRRLRLVQADMAALPFADHSFDLIWSEGAIYIIGFEKGLHLWRPLIKPGGFVALTEITWLKPNVPKEVSDYWQSAYPQMSDRTGNRERIQRAGYQWLADFTLPPSAWWDNYYESLASKMDRMHKQYGHDPHAAGVLKNERREMDLYRRYANWYGYVFYLMRRR